MLILIILLNVVFRNQWILEVIAEFVLPILTIFVLKRFLIWFVAKYFLVNKEKRLALKNKKGYLLLGHFNFFFDCLIITFVCFLQVIVSAFVNLFYMPRLDCSIFGRHMERRDIGFVSFVTFLHMEVNQTHPVMLSFAELLLEATKFDEQSGISFPKKRWLLLYTLIKNPNLRKQRKHYPNLNVAKVESFLGFLKRHMETKKRAYKSATTTTTYIKNSYTETNFWTFFPVFNEANLYF